MTSFFEKDIFNLRDDKMKQFNSYRNISKLGFNLVAWQKVTSIKEVISLINTFLS